MKFKRLISRVIASVLTCCLIISTVGEVVYAAKQYTNNPPDGVDKKYDTWGFNTGRSPYGTKMATLQKNYVGDYEILENLQDNSADNVSQSQGYATGSLIGNLSYKLSSSEQIQTAYFPYNTSHTGSDKALYFMLSMLTGADSKTFEKTFFSESDSKPSQFQKCYQKSSPGADATFCNKVLAPKKKQRYSPLNMLRLLQLYMVTRSGDEKCFIGGWPVQIKAKSTDSSYSYTLVGARTIATVYKAFTGMDFNLKKSRKKAEKGTNCTEDSICYKLMKGNLKMGKAVSKLKTALSKANITLYEGKNVLTAGAMTFEEYFARCVAGKSGTRYTSSNWNATYSVDDTFFKKYRNNVNKEFDCTRQNFYATVFRFFNEAGIRFYTSSEINSEKDIRSLFNNDKGYPVLNDNGEVKNMKASDKLGEVIGKAIKARLKLYSNLTEGNYVKDYAMGSYAGKPKMNKIYNAIMKDMLEATGESSTDKAKEVLSHYMEIDDSAPLCKSIDNIAITKVDKKTAKDVTSSAKKTVGGINNLITMNDAYVAEFFISLATNSGYSDSSIVNNEYAKIINVLQRSNVQKNKATMEECYTMLYSLTRIKQQGKTYYYTFNAKNNKQIGSILKYCKNKLPRTYKFFSKIKTNYNNSEITFGQNKDGKQKYSDWCEAYTTVISMGAKAYGVANNSSGDSANYDQFLEAYNIWKANLKSGMTKNVDGVQHQDGFVPYGLTSDSKNLGEETQKFFMDSENSMDGKNIVKDSDKDDSAQKKILKWEIDTEELNEALQENFWLNFVNSVIGIVGLLMLCVGFTLGCMYCLDHVSGNQYEITRKVTFKYMEYSFDKKLRRKTLFKFVVFTGLAALMYDGTIIKWALYIMQIAYQSMTTK